MGFGVGLVAGGRPGQVAAGDVTQATAVFAHPIQGHPGGQGLAVGRVQAPQGPVAVPDQVDGAARRLEHQGAGHAAGAGILQGGPRGSHKGGILLKGGEGWVQPRQCGHLLNEGQPAVAGHSGLRHEAVNARVHGCAQGL